MYRATCCGKTSEFLSPPCSPLKYREVADIISQPLLIDKSHVVPGSGAIILNFSQERLRNYQQQLQYNDDVATGIPSLAHGIEVLLVKEKPNDGTEGCYGFPKGKTCYKCQKCQIKNCVRHRNCQQCRNTEQLCSVHWLTCQNCQRRKETPYCLKHASSTDARQDGVCETIRECAFREVWQETGLDFNQLDHAVLGCVKNIGRNSYLLIATDRHETTPQREEIESIRWVSLPSLMVDVIANPQKYNMGVRKFFKRHLQQVAPWMSWMSMLYHLAGGDTKQTDKSKSLWESNQLLFFQET